MSFHHLHHHHHPHLAENSWQVNGFVIERATILHTFSKDKENNRVILCLSVFYRDDLFWLSDREPEKIWIDENCIRLAFYLLSLCTFSKDRSNTFSHVGSIQSRVHGPASSSNNALSSSTSTGIDFQPPYFPPPFTNVSTHQHSFDSLQSNHSQHPDYNSSSSSPTPSTFPVSHSAQSYNPLVRSSTADIIETSSALNHPYGAYAGYAASYYTRHPMVLDPESLQLYQNGLLATTDPTSGASFRVRSAIRYFFSFHL